MPNTLEEQLNSLMKIYTELEIPLEKEKSGLDVSRTDSKKRSRKIPMLILGSICLLASATGVFSASYREYREKLLMKPRAWLADWVTNKEGGIFAADLGWMAQELGNRTDSYVSCIPDAPTMREYAIQALTSEIDFYDRAITGIPQRLNWDSDFPPERIKYYTNKYAKLRQQAIAQRNDIERKMIHSQEPRIDPQKR